MQIRIEATTVEEILKEVLTIRLILNEDQFNALRKNSGTSDAIVACRILGIPFVVERN